MYDGRITTSRTNHNSSHTMRCENTRQDIDIIDITKHENLLIIKIL